MEKKLKAVRGAVCTGNTPESITENVCAMCGRIFSENGIAADDIVSVQFTVTKGITAMNPAAALRKGSVNIDVSSLALFCASEPDVCGSMENVIRVMVTAYMPADSEKVNIYMNGAEKLRPDFCGDRNR